MVSPQRMGMGLCLDFVSTPESKGGLSREKGGLQVIVKPESQSWDLSLRATALQLCLPGQVSPLQASVFTSVKWAQQ